MPRPYVLSESTYREVLGTAFEVAVLPWGATEAHNLHLPYGTDTIESESIARAAAELAWARGAKVLVLPAVPFGVNTGQRDIPFCLNMMPSTQQLLIRDLLPALEQHGVRKFVILNGHGGNDFRQVIRELQPSTSVVLVQVNWYQIVAAREFFTTPGDHAGELETSVMMRVAPELVRDLGSAGPGIARQHRIKAFREGWAWMPRPWTRVTDDTGVGDPAAASSEKGESYLTVVAERLAGLLVSLSDADPAAMYEPAPDLAGPR